MIILNMYVPAGVILAIVALFLFGCGFIAGYLFGSLTATGTRVNPADRKKKAPSAGKKSRA